MTITYISRGDATGTTFDTTGAVALVAVTVRWVNTETMVDSKGNTWTALTSHEIGTYRSRIFYCLAPTVGTGHTLESSAGGVSSGTIALYKLTGAASFTYDTESGANDGTVAATSCQPGSITPAADNAHLLCGAGIGSFNGASHAIDNGFTIGYSDVAETSGALVQTTAAAINPTISWTNSSRWVSSMASFLPAAGASAIRSLPTIGTTQSILTKGLVS